jgi:hypothetical protein
MLWFRYIFGNCNDNHKESMYEKGNEKEIIAHCYKKSHWNTMAEKKGGTKKL